jgi:hypothetical protein
MIKRLAVVTGPKGWKSRLPVLQAAMHKQNSASRLLVHCLRIIWLRALLAGPRNAWKISDPKTFPKLLRLWIRVERIGARRGSVLQCPLWKFNFLMDKRRKEDSEWAEISLKLNATVASFQEVPRRARFATSLMPWIWMTQH